MRLSKGELLRKFPQLKKFQDQKWFSDETVKEDCNYKKLPLKAAFECMKEIISFVEDNKFSNNWELCFSVKMRLTQLKDLLESFCEDTDLEKTLKGTNLHQQDTTH